MRCKRVRVRDFRNIEGADVSFCEGVNVLAGENAQGKTNLLEALFYTALGKSFRTQHDEDLIRFGAECAEISLDFSDSLRDQNLTVRMMAGKKRVIEHNKVKVTSFRMLWEVFGRFCFVPSIYL